MANSDILFIGQFPPPMHGVAQMNIYAQKALSSEFAVDTINLSSSKSINEIGRFNSKKIFSFLSNLISIVKSISRHKKIIAYFTICPTGYAFYRDIIIVGLLKLAKVNIIYHLHGQGITKNSERSLIHRLLYKFTFKNSDIIHLSKVFIPEVSKFVTRSRIHIINNCIGEINEPAKEDKNSKQIPSFIFLSNLMIGKGFIEYLEAIKALYKEGHDFRATLAGNAFDKNAKMRLDEWKKENWEVIDSGCLQILPACYGDEKYRLLAKHDYFVFPSSIDTYPMVLIEAMSAGLIPIATKFGAMPEMLDNGRCGLIIDPSQKSELPLAMKKLIIDKNLNVEIKHEIHKTFNSKYSYEEFKKKLISLIQEIGDRQ